MANDEDVARLRQGVTAWNDWRAQHPEHRVDLTDVDLRGANLLGVDLRGAKDPVEESLTKLWENLVIPNTITRVELGADLLAATAWRKSGRTPSRL